jgi:hypothetical protein
MPKKNVPTKHRCGSATVLLWKVLLDRPGDYKRRCTLTTGVSQILHFTKLISEIKVYSIQRSFILSNKTFYLIKYVVYITGITYNDHIFIYLSYVCSTGH